MNLEQIRRLAILIVGDVGEKISLTPTQFSDMLHLASLRHFKRKLGLPEEYKPGMPLPTQAYEITSRITEDLRRFKVVAGYDTSTPIVVSKTGKAEYPQDYYIISTITYQYNDDKNRLTRKVEVLSDLEYQERVSSLNETPDALFPVCNMQSDYIQFAPRNIGAVSMVYLRTPKPPVYFVNTNKGYYEYDDVNSVQLEWDEMNQIDIMVLFLSDLGVKLGKADVFNYANQIKERGI